MSRRPNCFLIGLLATLTTSLSAGRLPADEKIDFNRDIRPILSNNCFTCHGPDTDHRQADLRLDSHEGATADLGGYAAIKPGQPEASELLTRVVATDDTRMPPAEVSGGLSRREVDLLKRWIEQGAGYSRHWSFEPPVRPQLPPVKQADWPRNAIDHFVLKRLEDAGLSPSAVASKEALIRRVSLDLTGLPPSPAAVDEFVRDTDPRAYEKLVDRLLQSQAYGERWAASWLDLARYADSAGYANDPNRTIWLYRDWVIKAFNQNMPFDQFTIEQIAGDLLPDATESQKIATAFHRNTLTNGEGGTNDEEFRNVAIVDRVNTTMEVWMGTTVACAQCHNHKYDPISQKEYFQLFAFLNNTADNDQPSEAPTLSVLTDAQRQQKESWEAELAELRIGLQPAPDELSLILSHWQPIARRKLSWSSIEPVAAGNDGPGSIDVDGSKLLFRPQAEMNDPVVLQFKTSLEAATGLRLQARQLPGREPTGQERAGLKEIAVSWSADAPNSLAARYVRIELPGSQKFLHLAEVQVFQGTDNLATTAKANQSSTDFGGAATRAIDGNTDGDYQKNSVSHTSGEDNPWFELDLQSLQAIDRVVVWNRTDNNLQSRLDGYSVVLLDAEHQPIWKKSFPQAPDSHESIEISGQRVLPVKLASASSGLVGEAAATGVAAALIDGKQDSVGWRFTADDSATDLILSFPETQTVPGTVNLQITLTGDGWKPGSTYEFQLSRTNEEGDLRALPQAVTAAFAIQPQQRTEQQQALLQKFARAIYEAPAEELAAIAALEKRINDIKPVTVPILQELGEGRRRTTKIQVRGNFMVTGDEVSEGTPEIFHALPDDAPRNRLTLARWLVDRSNPLTARVLVNRYWAQLFGLGLVATSEDFGNQGEPPTHPQLLDWLAVELMDTGWDLKRLLKTIVMSATYRQQSQDTPELLTADPYNRLLSRGPRHRLSAEMIRDQALAAAGLLSDKMYGPSVNPPRPKLGLRAAFGGSTDWETSQGEDRYRRGLYTFWRRSMPYPSMAAFDAPSRNVCTSRRIPTNTPLQALVTLNDPVYIEAAQALGRRAIREGGESLDEQLAYAFRLCLCRAPEPAELERLVQLYGQARERFVAHPDDAQKLATDPIGPPPEGLVVVDLAAWTLVGNVLLNLDETLSKR